MTGHCQRDICLGHFDPLTGLIIVQCAADQAEILTIVTHPSYRQLGIAASLLRAAQEKLITREVSIVFLEVAEDNEPAIAFYRSAGFEPFGIRPAYYRRENGRVAALTFRKRLDAQSQAI